MSDKPDWEGMHDDVMRKLNLLRLAWEHTAAGDPALHETLKRDLYLPALKLLGSFCTAIEDGEAPR